MTGRTAADCLMAAYALEGAIHLLDDDESAETLARLADQWRAEAAELEQAPHSYQHVGSGRWVCETCNEFIVNRDCRENQRWLTDRSRQSAVPRDDEPATSGSQRPSTESAPAEEPR